MQRVIDHKDPVLDELVEKGHLKSYEYQTCCTSFVGAPAVKITAKRLVLSFPDGKVIRVSGSDDWGVYHDF